MTIGTEHEYSINNNYFNALPDSDKIIKRIHGKIEPDIPFGEVILGKELQKTVIEFIPNHPSDNLKSLENQLVSGIQNFYSTFQDQYWLLGLGMHPTLTLDQTSVWNHSDREYYETYDRLFNIHQHGWLNIQALQINLSYSTEKDLLAMYNTIRLLLPYLIAITASSPIVEGNLTNYIDNRLIFYRTNQKEIPDICNNIIPEQLTTINNYYISQNKVFSKLKLYNAHILCEEWVNSSGLIIRPSRKCIEIKALDEQESIQSDMAVCAFIQALLRCPSLPIDQDQKTLLDITDTAIKHGTTKLQPELKQLFTLAQKYANKEEQLYLPIIKNRIENGNLAEIMCTRYKEKENISSILHDMALCLKTNSSITSFL